MSTNKLNSGLIAINKKKTKDSQPDYRGNANIAGVDHWVSGWIRENEYGKYLSLAFEVKSLEVQDLEKPEIVEESSVSTEDTPF